MNLQTLFRRRRTRPTTNHKPDWASNFTPRDWADLPTHHPRRDDGAN